jgi:uncharacterized protein
MADFGHLVSSTYKAPWWLAEGHLQTVAPALFMPQALVEYQRFRVEFSDSDFVHVDALPDLIKPDCHTPFVLLFHGLEGSSKSHYALALMNELKRQGLRGAVAHWRGCSGEPNALKRSYHSGASEDIGEVVEWLLQQVSEETPICLVGVSLGGNALLKWLGEERRKSRQRNTQIKAAIAISAPQDLEAGANRLANGISRAYTRNFMGTMIPKSEAKLERFDMPFTREQLLRCRGFHDFDEVVTAPLHGYKDAKDYWQRCSCKQFLKYIAIPTLVINAKNDPFLPAQVLARTDEVSSSVTLEYPDTGGHVGFASGPFPGHLNWLPQRALEFFKQQHPFELA